jgi:negative regulator of sigma E activity
MSDVLNEQLSALIDGELPAAETTLLLKRLERDAALRAGLERYQALGDAVRGASVRQRPDFAQRVSAALADEPTHTMVEMTPAIRSYPRAARMVGGLAVAASVAALALFTVGRQAPPAGAPGQSMVAATTPDAPAATAAHAVRAERRAAPATSGVAQLAAVDMPEPVSYVTPGARPSLGAIPPAELASYVVAHSSVSGMLGVRSVLTGLVADDPVPEAPNP